MARSLQFLSLSLLLSCLSSVALGATVLRNVARDSQGSSCGPADEEGGIKSFTISIGAGCTPGQSRIASAYAAGGGAPIVIPNDQLFAGRMEGGGTRGDIFGTRTYGSGYPGKPDQKGVAGLGFPFFFWPITWGAASKIPYLDGLEYGDTLNSTRPGGVLSTTTFTSNSDPNSTFRLLTDNSTATSLISAITNSCPSLFSSSASGLPGGPIPFDPSISVPPHPKEAVQYYRASSVVLTLDDYNNSAALAPSADASGNQADAPLPDDVDAALLDCLNITIGAAVPLVNSAARFWVGIGSDSGPFVIALCISLLLFA